jgi:lambda family phage tail tape measure protein
MVALATSMGALQIAAVSAAKPTPPTPFANGGIVQSPTSFLFAKGSAMEQGIMGEAGAEAIMPLSRGSDGALGVNAYGAGMNATIITMLDGKVLAKSTVA